MNNKRYKQKIDRLFYFVWIPTIVLLGIGTAIAAGAPVALAILIATDLFTLYFLISPFFGYVELGDGELFIKFGFFAKLTIPYDKIRGVCKEKKIYADSVMSLKNSLEHVNVKYNRFDIVSVSVTDNDGLIRELDMRIQSK